MPTVLITGANRGIGLEFARQYSAAGWVVHAAARRPEAAEELARIDGKVSVHTLDITKPDQIQALSGTLDGTPIDLLINNAGVGMAAQSELGEIDYDGWLQTLAINAVAPLRLTEAFIDNIAASDQKLIAFMSSRAGSITNNIAGGRYPYRTSKAALNMVVRSLAIDLIPKGVITVALHPGWVRTDMGGDRAPLDPFTSVQHMRALIDRLEPHYNGHFLNYDGADLSW